MSDEARSNDSAVRSDHNGSPFIFWFLLVGFVIVVYLLSPGPVVKIIEVFFENSSSDIRPYVRGFYAPIIWSMEQIDWIDSFYKWYLEDLWGVH